MAKKLVASVKVLSLWTKGIMKKELSHQSKFWVIEVRGLKLFG